MKSFIKVMEVWVPRRDRQRLELAGGVYGKLLEFRSLSEARTFGYDEGLPGRAWAQGRPLVLTDFDKSYFQRAEAARAAGLNVGIALPIFSGEFLLAVVVLLCGDHEEQSAALEVWQVDTEAGDMGLTEGYYGSLERFEWISRRIRFTHGHGLPGRIWESRRPLLIADLAGDSTFLRARNALESGISTALGIPCIHADSEVSVLSILSARGAPIARRFEIWVANAQRDGLVFLDGYCHAGDDLSASYQDTVIPRLGSELGAVWATGTPLIKGQLDTDGSPPEQSGLQQGLHAMLAFPVVDQGRLNAMVLMMI